jgi:hypothetical protein
LPCRTRSSSSGVPARTRRRGHSETEDGSRGRLVPRRGYGWSPKPGRSENDPAAGRHDERTAFTPAKQEILGRLGEIVGQIFGAYIYTQNRLAGLEDLLKERRILTDAEIEEANRRADERWKSGLMIDSLLDQDMHTLLEELRQRIKGDEPA